MRTKSTGGFTLIELLIVIAIIGILAAVLIPNLLSARERAFDTAMQACAKGFATAAEIYAIDYGAYNESTVGPGLDAAWAIDNGANACVTAAPGPVISNITLTGSTYEATVTHSNTGRSLTVDEEGISAITAAQ